MKRITKKKVGQKKWWHFEFRNKNEMRPSLTHRQKVGGDDVIIKIKIDKKTQKERVNRE